MCVHKRDSKENKTNYCQIISIEAFSSCMESIMNKQILSICLKNEMKPNQQFARRCWINWLSQNRDKYMVNQYREETIYNYNYIRSCRCLSYFIYARNFLKETFDKMCHWKYLILVKVIFQAFLIIQDILWFNKGITLGGKGIIKNTSVWETNVIKWFRKINVKMSVKNHKRPSQRFMDSIW